MMQIFFFFYEVNVETWTLFWAVFIFKMKVPTYVFFLSRELNELFLKI